MMMMGYFCIIRTSFILLILLMLTVPRVTVNAAVSSPHYMPVGCRTYSEHGGQLERCQGLYTLERTWDEAIARCRSDGWTGLVMSDTEDVETTVGDFLMWMDDELDADNGYSAWIGGHEIDDRVWTWNDGTTFQRERMEAASVTVKLSDEQKKFENCVQLGVTQNTMTLSLTSAVCRTMHQFFICQLNDNETVAECQLNGTTGIRLGQSCYVAFPATVIQSKASWTAGVASWFKANNYCHSIGANLATFDDARIDSNSTKTIVGYLVHVSPAGPFWIGLTRNPWVWVEEYDEAGDKVTRSSPIYFSDWLEPDQPIKERMNCMSVGANVGRYGWSSERCERRLPFVCENRTLTLWSTAVPETTAAMSTAGSDWAEGHLSTEIPPTNSTTAASQPHHYYSVASVVIVVCVLVAVAVLVVALTIYWCLRIRRRSGYSPQP